jgi:hypothetical protein
MDRAKRRARNAYGLAALALVATFVIGIVVPRSVPTAECRMQLDCFDHLNATWLVLIILGMVMTLVLVLVGSFQSYLAER